MQAQVIKTAALSSAAASFLAAGNVSAAQEVADLAARDGRFGIVALLALPALGWVGFNIFGPALNQLQQTAQKNKRTARWPKPLYLQHLSTTADPRLSASGCIRFWAGPFA